MMDVRDQDHISDEIKWAPNAINSRLRASLLFNLYSNSGHNTRRHRERERASTSLSVRRQLSQLSAPDSPPTLCDIDETMNDDELFAQLEAELDDDDSTATERERGMQEMIS